MGCPNGSNSSIIYTGHDEVWALDWAPDGSHIVCAGGGDGTWVSRVSAGGHPYEYKGNTFSVYGVAWSPDGHRIVSGGEGGDADGIVKVWNAADGSMVYGYDLIVNSTTVTAGVYNVSALAWSPNGQYIAMAGDYQKPAQARAVTLSRVKLC